eukprot:TRINITY_DN11378_c0_g1_i2.p1 TRINITY_DN11378_c0_g1~~TRINITY_DN11378_c0_g1_i2.p1  ORF type:complete len:252 (-),score=55.31 TRINITY_DN11378_c0_g1_i2:393-1079(-)
MCIRDRWGTVICVAVSMSQLLLVTRANVKLGIPDTWFCFSDSLVIMVLGEINSMPVLVLACKMCPKNIEGTMYALLMSVINFGSLISYQLGGIIVYLLGITETDFSRLWILILFTNLAMLSPIGFLLKVRFEDATELAEKADEEDGIGHDENVVAETELSRQKDIEVLDAMEHVGLIEVPVVGGKENHNNGNNDGFGGYHHTNYGSLNQLNELKIANPLLCGYAVLKY